MDSQSKDININQSKEISTQRESVVFHTETTSTGRKIHYASHSTLFYNRRDVLKSGRSYFVCSERTAQQDYMLSTHLRRHLIRKNYQYFQGKFYYLMFTFHASSL